MALAPVVRAAVGRGALRASFERKAATGARAVGRFSPPTITVLAGLLLVWARFIPLTQSFWNDEAFSALAYIRPGPGAIFGSYIPNDHILFELLAWTTTNVTGDFSEATMRFWSVAPDIAAATIMTWWLWRRLDPWVATMFGVLAASAPLYMRLGTEARGYGLGYFAAAVMLVAVDALMWHPRRGDLWLFGGSAIVGIWTLPVFVLAFLPLAALLMTRKPLRRDALRAVIAVGTASFAFYLPVIGDLISSSGQKAGVQLPWDGVATGPLRDLISPTVVLLLPHASLSASEILGGSLIALGLLVLWRRPERVLALALILPTLGTYLFIEVFRLYEADRFVSFLQLPLLVLCAVALVQAGRLVARLPLGRPVAVAGAIALSLFVLNQAEASFAGVTQNPIENFKEVQSIVNRSGISRVVSNSTQRIGFIYYLGPNHVEYRSPAELQVLFCSNAAPFVYLEHSLSPLPSTTCLRRRGAVSIQVPQARGTISIWLLTANTSPTGA